jgi:hypothetical protein
VVRREIWRSLAFTKQYRYIIHSFRVSQEKIKSKAWHKEEVLAKEFVKNILLFVAILPISCLSPAYHTSHTHQKRKRPKSKRPPFPLAPTLTYPNEEIEKEQKQNAINQD